MQEKRYVKGSFNGIHGNSFMLMGYFQKLAKQQGFSKEWIKQVLDEAMSSDYNHLVGTLLMHMEENDNE
ncbi:MAG: hypothetical protein ACRCV0_00910 [Brevinema sp.]